MSWLAASCSPASSFPVVSWEGSRWISDYWEKWPWSVGPARGSGLLSPARLHSKEHGLSIVSRDADAIRRAAADIEQETGAEVLALGADLQVPDAPSRWHAATEERFGGIDALFTNTGGPPPGVNTDPRRRGVAVFCRPRADECRAPDPPGCSIDAGTGWRGSTRIHVGIREGADAEHDVLERCFAPRSGPWRRRSRSSAAHQTFVSTQCCRVAFQQIGCARLIARLQRARASQWPIEKRKRSRLSRWRGTARLTSSAALQPSSSQTRHRTSAAFLFRSMVAWSELRS